MFRLFQNSSLNEELSFMECLKIPNLGYLFLLEAAIIVCVFQGVACVCPVHPSYWMYGCKVFVIFYYLCVLRETVVISPLSFLILIIWVISLFFLVSLARDLSMLLAYSKKQLLVSLIFCISLFSISFTFTLTHIIFFPFACFGFSVLFFF